MRRGFGIMTALAILLLVAGMLTLVLKYASLNARHTADSYLREQAELFGRSTVERALLQIADRNRSHDGCWEGNDSYRYEAGHGKIYTASVRVDKYYLYGEGCSNGVPVVDIGTPESHGYVLLEVEVNATLDGRPKVRILRRMLQRP